MRYEFKNRVIGEGLRWEDMTIEIADLTDDLMAQSEAQRLADASGHEYRWNHAGSGQGHYVFPQTDTDTRTEPVTETVELIASGYEWVCPDCETMNNEIEAKAKVTCRACSATFQTEPPEHAYG